MDKAECLSGCLSRVKCCIEYKEDGKIKSVSAVCSGQSYESYASTVDMHKDAFHMAASREHQFGSFLNWDNHDSWIMGDGSAAFLGINDEKLVLYQKQYDDPDVYSECKEWPAIPKITMEICELDAICKMTFVTTSGWVGECYPERTYGEKRHETERRGFACRFVCPDCGAKLQGAYIECPDCDWRDYSEDAWVCILHRSTGAVTIERAFPFPVNNQDREIAEPENTIEPDGIESVETETEENPQTELSEDYEEPEVIHIENSDEDRRQVNGVWQHTHGGYDYWHPMLRVHKETK